MEEQEDIQNYSTTFIFRGTPCMYFNAFILSFILSDFPILDFTGSFYTKKTIFHTYFII